MPKFRGSDFEIELPTGSSDESTYAFAFRARGGFRPSVTVKTERLATPTELGAYVDRQLENIQKLLPEVAVIGRAPVQHGEGPAYVAVYDFGEAARRVRQKQTYIQLQDPARIVTLTGTGLKESFGEVDDLFEAVFRSFHVSAPDRGAE
jgi:hypothetical protein